MVLLDTFSKRFAFVEGWKGGGVCIFEYINSHIAKCVYLLKYIQAGGASAGVITVACSLCVIGLLLFSDSVPVDHRNTLTDVFLFN